MKLHARGASLLALLLITQLCACTAKRVAVATNLSGAPVGSGFHSRSGLTKVTKIFPSVRGLGKPVPCVKQGRDAYDPPSPPWDSGGSCADANVVVISLSDHPRSDGGVRLFGLPPSPKDQMLTFTFGTAENVASAGGRYVVFTTEVAGVVLILDRTAGVQKAYCISHVGFGFSVSGLEAWCSARAQRPLDFTFFRRGILSADFAAAIRRHPNSR